MSEAKIKELIKRRGGFKAKLTHFSNFLRLLPNNDLDNFQAAELKSRLNLMETLYKEFDVLQTDLELMSEDADDMYAEREQFETQYHALVARARTHVEPARAPSPALMSATSTDDLPQHGSGCKHDFVRLPKIDLPHFDGDYQHWLEFRDTYLSLIHHNNSIQEINKFHYLRAALTGSASLVLKSIDFKADNYGTAWQLLLERYNNERLLVNNHVQALFNLEQFEHESCSSLRNMIDVTNKNLCALSTLGQPTEQGGLGETLIIHMMSDKLDKVTRREWEEHKNNLDAFPHLKDYIKFLSNRADLLESLNNNKNTTNTQNIKENNKTKSYLTTTKTKQNNSDNVKCPMCSQNHFLFSCQSFRNLEVEARIKKASESNVCLNCLRPGHSVKRCNLSHCKYCKVKHNTLLHRESTTEKPTGDNIALSSNVVLPCSDNNQVHILLSTALAKVTDVNGELHTARILLDNGSTSNFITQELCGKLGLVRQSTSSTVSGINGQVSSTSETCSLHLQSCDGSYQAKVSCFVMPKITQSLPGSYVDKRYITIPPGIQLADPSFNIPSAINILVGAEVFWDVLGSDTINLGKNQPRLQSSKLGWLISGRVSQLRTQPSVCHFLSQEESDQVTRFWELDTVSSDSCFSTEEQACEKLFQETTRRDTHGQFVVTIPLKDSPKCLGDSYAMAKRRFLSLERRFERDSTFKNRYLQFMQEYIDLHHMTEYSQPNPSEFNYFLPHHGVVRESSTTTKLRVVYDASATSTSGKSFNDIQMVGPTVQEDLLSILLRYRQHKFVVTGDIEKMYRAILVEPSQRPLQQIVFRFNSSDPLKTYTLNTVTYGTASAPYLATKCLVSLADQCSDPEVSQSIRRDFYVDDYLSGGDSIETVIKLCQGVVNNLESAKFHLRKWQSNSPKILESVTNINTENIDKKLNLSDSPSKTLGLYWDCKTDRLFFSIDSKQISKITKRNILSLISQVFDPLGLVGPCIVQAKLMLQQLWILKCNWDDEVPTEIKSQFHEFLHSLPALNSLHIPRWVSCNNASLMELHTFTDASERAYGACIYVRTVAVDGTVCVRLLASKNRVAPIKPTTIPRLELCGALLGTRLFLKVRKSLTLEFNHCYFWCDSTIVLGWLSTLPSRLEQFVRNRVSEIQEATTGQTWSYVPSKSNPADLVSRGVKADCISSSTLWWSGPDFLNETKIQFPISPNTQIHSLPEISLHTAADTFKQNNINIISHLIHKKSSFTSLIRIIGYVQRFIFNCRKQNNKKSSYLTLSELKSSKTLILQISQQEMFPEEYTCLKTNQALHKKNRLISLSPFIDSDNLIRVGGRLNNSNYSYDVMHPILLCSKHDLTKIIFEKEHKALFHAGPQLLLAHIRLTYWPLAGRNLAKHIVRKCVRCNRFKAQPIQVIMGDLPTDRTHLEYPFLNTGVDYAGPVLIANRRGRGCKLIKSYICVFVCFAVKAVHLELVSDLTKEAFLAAFSRFISRRGKPQRVYSDNGTTFVGAFNELSRFLKVSSSNIESDLANKGIEFKFIPAYSPHFGGIWESAVKSTKHLLRRVMSLTHLTYEELSTCLIQIEAILNSRPLTPLSTDPSDLSYLCPSHFLIGRPLTSFPRPQITDVNIQRLQRFDRVEKLRQHFWQRFSNEYVSLLQQKTKWQTAGQDLKTGAMVLVRDANLPPLLWLLGRVVAVKTGSDGHCRVADILTKKGTITRAYNNICPLPVSSTSS